MINREISYERDVNKSYMKIPAMPEKSYDEKLLLKKTITGLIPMEKCYVNSIGEYWYDISGKQALDAYCRVNGVGKTFFENLILRFCEQVETLEWNLIDTNCLVLDTELIFVNHSGEEIYFVAYPYNKGDLFLELQQLMEYLLTKLNHAEREAVSAAYQIYELTLTESFSIVDLKNHILEARMDRIEVNVLEREQERVEKPCYKSVEETSEPKSANHLQDWEARVIQFLQDKLDTYQKKVKDMVGEISFLKPYLQRTQQAPMIVYPNEEEEVTVTEVHPTICIASGVIEPRGILVCDTKGEAGDIQLEKDSGIIGKSTKARFRIARDTVSHLHARVEYQDGGYYIEDLNSTNGTFVNDAALHYKQKCRLSAGDRVRFADITYYFY